MFCFRPLTPLTFCQAYGDGTRFNGHETATPPGGASVDHALEYTAKIGGRQVSSDGRNLVQIIRSVVLIGVQSYEAESCQEPSCLQQ